MNNNASGANTLSLRSPSRPTEKRGAQAELEKARAETKALRAQAAAAQEAAEKLRLRMLKSTRDAKLRLRVTAAIMMTAALVKLAWQAANAPPPVVVSAMAQPLPSLATALSVHSNRKTVDGANAADYSEGALALERLRNAFHSFPEVDQADLVRKVNEKRTDDGPACPLAWNDNGIPALYLHGTKEAVPPLMAAVLNRCAGAIEDLRAQRDSAQLR